VTYVNADDAATAKDAANEQELEGRPMYIDFAQARDDSPKTDVDTEDNNESSEETEE